MVILGFPRKQLFPGQRVSEFIFIWGKLLYTRPPTPSTPKVRGSDLWGLGSSYCGSAISDLTSIHEDTGLIPGLALWVKVPALL